MVYVRSTDEETAIVRFVANYFDADGLQELSAEEQERVAAVKRYVEGQWSMRRSIATICLDFICFAQELAKAESEYDQFDANRSLDEVFERFPIKRRAGREQRTLSVTVGSGEVGIRKILNQLETLFHHDLHRPSMPSSAPDTTGKWRDHREILENCFQLSKGGRIALFNEVLDFALALTPRSDVVGSGETRVELFPIILSSYPRSAPNENAGLSLQAMVYGYLAADRRHLDIRTDKVRSGSKRQHRLGDIDCYQGIRLEHSTEVRDRRISADNVNSDLGRFVGEVRQIGGKGLVVAQEVDPDASTQLTDISAGRVTAVTVLDLYNQVSRTWDWPKQEVAVQGMLFYLKNIEQNEHAVTRLLRFIEIHDPDHLSLDLLPRAGNEEA